MAILEPSTSVNDASAVSSVPDSIHEPIIIEARKGWWHFNWRDLWDYRELLFFLVWRDIKVRYKQTLLGASWALIQPTLQLVVFTIIFGRLAGVNTNGIPYPLFNLAGLLPWQFFANTVAQAANSLVGSASIVRKVYFPRLAIPTASVLAGTVDFGLSFLILLALMFWYQWAPTPAVFLLPLFMLLGMITALGVGFWLSAINARYRDVRHATPFLIQLWLFATPVVYPSNLIEGHWQIVYALNPMVSVVEGFRWALLGTQPPSLLMFISVTTAIALFSSGLLYFQAVERKFADII
ncbi:MAG: ABC transporter permease [Chloroflexus sp.]|jgi:lipopolysaccharide transport system permease protein|uniref:ABC transporter permease n=1 Tax=unclassified Chloroflexus TaxID=2633855 RepID=UPI0004DF52C9|nr:MULTISPECIES: ABC transporter permease [unclassified Chloroflexus]MBO9311895.1 ABC transporter permease [Chloroflexus sp.]MBO9315980.1 ABC transporter permease [Chloroflexus sp.]MBO9318349.1 ABC transporter permease [Chloroflexus sp.]MBO9337540.1 ABC transporter permease [Chloroflexus sp.]MBO9372847.1 ABC transporter permease [Chloroflexus sp.]